MRRAIGIDLGTTNSLVAYIDEYNRPQVVPTDEVMLITRGGIVIRTKVSEISEIGRNTQGVRLINLESGDQLIDVAKVEEKEEEGEEE